MQKVREVVTLGLQSRQKAGVPVRQPLAKISVVSFEGIEKYIEIIKDELNIKNIDFILNEKKETLEISVFDSIVILDSVITEELKQEGNYRELIRAIQDMRKKNGLNPNDIVEIEISTSEEGEDLVNKWQKELLKAVGAKDIQIKDISGDKIKIGDLEFVINVVK